MAALSDADIIAQNPIGSTLDGFRGLLESECDKLGISATEDGRPRITQLAELSDLKTLATELVLALQPTRLARTLPSRDGTGTLQRDLILLGADIASGRFNARSFVPMFERVDGHASDQEICAALLTLLTEKISTPSPIVNEPHFGTPVKSNSSSQRAEEQTHDTIDLRILQEVNGCVYRDTGGFYKRYFEGKDWSGDAEQIAQRANPPVENGRWTEYPRVPSQRAFLDWFNSFQAEFLQGGRGKYDASPDLPLAGSACQRKPDLFLTLPNVSRHGGRYHWADIRVIGELKQSEIQGKRTEELLDFCGLAREVFASQPTRRFLHGFFVRGSTMELWVFDRSGLYGCEKFDIHQDPCRFIKIMAGYSLMGDQELGINTHIREDETGKYIMFKGDGEEEEGRLDLEDKPIAFQRAIVCRGTTCYRAKRQGSERWEYVVKFAWRSDKRRAEGELLKLARERNVWGVARLFGHQDLEAIADLRQGLQFGKRQWFRSAKRDSINQSGLLANALGISLASLSVSSSEQKRKRQGRDSVKPAKRSKSGGRRRSKTTSQSTAQIDGAADGGMDSIEEPIANSLASPESRDDGLFDNRIFSCLVISPPGRAIYEFGAVEELLESCRDFIRAHRSLHYDGKILHRDISGNNIIITDAEREGDPKGMLIDLDLAKELDSRRSGARHRTGTMEFMAIEVLKGRAHTYRHDLESFFYVFLWVVIQGRDRALPETSCLRLWYAGSYNQIAAQKKGDMDKGEFEEILDEFPAEFEILTGLAEELRGILFPIRKGALFTGTYRDPDRLYMPMIDAFQKAIRGVSGE